MQLFFTHREAEEDITDGQAQMAVIKVPDKQTALQLKATYSKIFKGQSSIITNNHKENKSCTEEMI